MIAVVKENSGPDFVVKEVPIPEISEDEVLINVKTVGICGSDVPILKGIRPVTYPLIPGHEFAGDIVSVGKNVTSFKVGDRVTPSLVIGCGKCKYCQIGMENLCDSIVETGIHVDGAYAQYVKVPQKVLHKIPDSMSYEHASTVDLISTAYRAIQKANVGIDNTVLIYGPGSIGLYTLQMALLSGAKKIICVGKSGDEKRLKLAADLGANFTINASCENLYERINEICKGDMPDIVFDATGDETVFDQCLNTVARAGKIVLIGVNCYPSTGNVEKIVRNEINVSGVICATRLDFAKSLEIVASKKITIDPLITHHFDLSDIHLAMKEIDAKKTIKVMLHV